jgi:dTDP-glucose 4,6-dehydratase
VTDYQPRNVLVTGGAGFIGSNFVRYLLETDETVKLVHLDPLTYAGSLDNLECLPDPTRHTFVKGDICDRDLVNGILRKHEIDTVVHFAADSHVDRSITGPAPFIQTNFVGTFHLLEATRDYWLEERSLSPTDCRFHHISTDEVYGTLGPSDPSFTEHTAYAPNSPYSASKAGSDHLVRAYVHTYGLPATSNNCSNNYGPYQHREKFIPTIIGSCLEKRPIPVYGDGSNIRDWLYVLDHCRGIDAVVRRGRMGECYNIGGCSEWANVDLVKTICRVLDELLPDAAPHSDLIEFVKDRPGHDWRYAIDITKIRRELGWEPVETLETGIRKTVEWYHKRLAGLQS